MSRQHAEIAIRSGNFIISDLGSTHGTWVDGVRVGEAQLTDGSRIRLGDGEFVFRLSQAAIPTAIYYDDQ
jgi:pSer/pThr/pTyr-binding forkhead associated (FHA) protein